MSKLGAASGGGGLNFDLMNGGFASAVIFPFGVRTSTSRSSTVLGSRRCRENILGVSAGLRGALPLGDTFILTARSGAGYLRIAEPPKQAQAALTLPLLVGVRAKLELGYVAFEFGVTRIVGNEQARQDLPSWAPTFALSCGIGH